jgi:hypothetical protein
MNKVLRCLSFLTSLTLLGTATTTEAAVVRAGATTQAIFANTRGTAVAYDSVNHVYLVVSTMGIVRGRFVDGNGTPIGDPFQIQTSANFTLFPTVAFSPDADGGAGGFLVVWHESVLPTLATVNARIVSFGKRGPAGAESVLSAEGSFWEQYPAAAYSTVSQEFLVTWVRFDWGVRAIRADNAGVPQGAVFTITRTAQYEGNPSVAYNPATNQYLVVWKGWNDPGKFGFVDARLVQAGTNQLLGAAATRIYAGGGTYITDVAYNPATNQFLAAWYRDAGGTSKAMLGRLVNADASLPGDVTVLSTLWKAYDGLGLAYNIQTGTFFMVSHDGRGLTTSVEDGGVEVGKTGTPVDNGFLVTAGDGKPNFYPRIAASADAPNWLMCAAHNFQYAEVQLLAGTPSGDGPPPPPPPPGPKLKPDQTSLAFGVISGAPQRRTSAQSVRLIQSGDPGTVTWTALTSAAWLQVSPTSGTGASVLTVSLVADALPATTSSATITIAATGASSSVPPISVSLNVLTAAASKPPFGSVDSPADSITGVSGSMAITGWAIDDVDVTRVRILRDPVAGEAPGLVYLGDGMFVEGARPDVAAAYPTNPQNARAGWGHLLLTNMLPGLGNGTFKFYAYADDADGHSTLLGTRIVTCANSGATQPFGTVDTPAPGETVAGSVYTSYGWVLAHGTRRADVPGGGTVTVFIDGTPVGSPTGWTGRVDLQAVFPSLEYSGVPFALGAFDFDTTTLSNGMHTISWSVTDNEGNAAGVGSRFFRVFNGGSSQMASVKGAGSLIVSRDVAGAVADTGAIEARRGYALDVPFLKHEADAAGRVTLHSEELDRIELQTHGATDGYMVTSAGLRPLPIGSRLDPFTGVFVWQTGVGFIGSYDLAFLRHAGGRLVRQDVRIVLDPKGSNRIGPQIVVDLVGQVVAGWAADLDSQVDRGIDLIHVWAYPAAGGHPVFVGEASYGGERPDVAAVYGERFHATGYGIRVQGLEPGTYDLAIFAWSSAKRGWLPAKVVRIVVPAL